jgi:hypothetical protein
MFQNRVLSEKFEVEGVETLVNRQKSLDKLGELSTLSDNQQFGQVVAQVARAGLPDDFETFEKLFDPIEVEFRKAFAIPSKRPGGARSMGTGFVLHKNIKSYKSTVKGAYEHGVELLDAAGVPRSRKDISDDIKAAKQPKDTEEKLMGAVEMYAKLRDEAVNTDPRTIDADNRLINYLRANGYNVEAKVAAAA